MLENYKDVLTVKELKEILRIGFNRTYDLLRAGKIESIRVGNKIIIPKTAVIKFLNSNVA